MDEADLTENPYQIWCGADNMDTRYSCAYRVWIINDPRKAFIYRLSGDFWLWSTYAHDLGTPRSLFLQYISEKACGFKRGDINHTSIRKSLSSDQTQNLEICYCWPLEIEVASRSRVFLFFEPLGRPRFFLNWSVSHTVCVTWSAYCFSVLSRPGFLRTGAAVSVGFITGIMPWCSRHSFLYRMLTLGVFLLCRWCFWRDGRSPCTCIPSGFRTGRTLTRSAGTVRRNSASTKSSSRASGKKQGCHQMALRGSH